MLKGCAGSKETAEYFNTRGELGGWLEAPGWHCSAVGFGSYRVDNTSKTHAEALRTALIAGCNLFDTSTNYTDGESEKAIGGAVDELIRRKVLDREQVIIVSKVGYVQGQALELAEQRERAGQPFAEMVKYQPGCWHCIHPDFISVQFEKSRERLGMEVLDSYLLHNPEYFFMAGPPGDLAAQRLEFYRRVQKAFECLETLVEKGCLQNYGVSSNTFGAAADDPTAVSLSEVWAAAERAAISRGKKPSEHHFQIAQMPLNLFESGPFLRANTGPGNAQTALEFASEKGLGVLTNRPLNAFHDGSMVRLSEAGPAREEIRSALAAYVPAAWHCAPLSQQALGVLIYTPGVSCVLVGMRRPIYVDDAWDATRLPRLEETEIRKIYELFAGATVA